MYPVVHSRLPHPLITFASLADGQFCSPARTVWQGKHIVNVRNIIAAQIEQMQTGKKSRFSKAALNTPSPPGVGVPPRFGDIRDFLAILSDIREKLARTG